MGLYTTHGCWHGSYHSFMDFRTALCAAAGLGELRDRIGFGGALPWPKKDAIVTLLNHSDCQGRILARQCRKLADRMQSLLPKMPGWQEEMHNWIDGLRDAAARREAVEFH